MITNTKCGIELYGASVCGTCAYFRLIEDGLLSFFDNGSSGYCKRHAPVAGSGYPKTTLGDWCGDWAKDGGDK